LRKTATSEFATAIVRKFPIAILSTFGIAGDGDTTLSYALIAFASFTVGAAPAIHLSSAAITDIPAEASTWIIAGLRHTPVLSVLRDARIRKLKSRIHDSGIVAVITAAPSSTVLGRVVRHEFALTTHEEKRCKQWQKNSSCGF
jgi:hypothetical protein